jgi:hypothetical protein
LNHRIQISRIFIPTRNFVAIGRKIFSSNEIKILSENGITNKLSSEKPQKTFDRQDKLGEQHRGIGQPNLWQSEAPRVGGTFAAAARSFDGMFE